MAALDEPEADEDPEPEDAEESPPDDFDSPAAGLASPPEDVLGSAGFDADDAARLSVL